MAESYTRSTIQLTMINIVILVFLMAVNPSAYRFSGLISAVIGLAVFRYSSGGLNEVEVRSAVLHSFLTFLSPIVGFALDVRPKHPNWT